MEELNSITEKVIKAAITVHQELGPGLLESVYQRCMEIELQEIRVRAKPQVPVKVKYRGKDVGDEAFRMDLLVEDQVVVELKSVEEVKAVHKKQLLSYLRLAKKPIGLLINFNETMLRHGITRIANQAPGNKTLTGSVADCEDCF